MLRDDLLQISGWMKPNSMVLDLGCGDGELLDYVQKKSAIRIQFPVATQNLIH